MSNPARGKSAAASLAANYQLPAAGLLPAMALISQTVSNNMAPNRLHRVGRWRRKSRQTALQNLMDLGHPVRRSALLAE
jgi:hypothetical protein